MRRIPLAATVAVVLAVAAMLALGVWQLQRRAEKGAMIARFTANAGKPVMALPGFPYAGALFRRVSAHCLEVTDWTTTAGRTRDGATGWRHVAHCRTGAEGPGFRADMGVSNDPKLRPAWQGGVVTGMLTQASTGQPAIAALFAGKTTGERLIVSETAAPGLAPSRQPDPADLPNNHLAYAVQWFAFAAIALVIYVLALRRRLRG
ncbi:SURF1 family protein [Sphingomonas sp. PL-96]|uniref:SURF1 family protein n=1 Tax=Sphingomonas sp. PL-96 TaxID=2887201 RepID=UPI001E5CCD01|nr:SURF1 family protein [Sphingomonas sp. PL-96]MCC2978109.1 SURF1 family protein [Sphingomonas sp. PL-96]